MRPKSWRHKRRPAPSRSKQEGGGTEASKDCARWVKAWWTWFTLSRGQIREGGVVLVPGRDAGGSIDLAGDIVFQVGGDPGRGLTFLPEYQLEGKILFLLGIQEYSDKNYMLEVGSLQQVPFCPDLHGLALSPTAGLMSLFCQVEVTYGGSYHDLLKNLVCGGANVAAKISALEASLALDPGGNDEDEDRVGLPCFNQEADRFRPPIMNGRYRQTETTSFKSIVPGSHSFPFKCSVPGKEPHKGSEAHWGGGMSICPAA